jgi:hypothetical protein
LHVDPAGPSQKPENQSEKQPTTTRKVQLRRCDLGRPFMCTILPLQDHDDFVSGNGALAQNFPASRAEGF